MSLNEQQQKFDDNYSSCYSETVILHDTVKLRISKLPYTLTTLRELIFARSNFPKIFFRKKN